MFQQVKQQRPQQVSKAKPCVACMPGTHPQTARTWKFSFMVNRCNLPIVWQREWGSWRAPSSRRQHGQGGCENAGSSITFTVGTSPTSWCWDFRECTDVFGVRQDRQKVFFTFESVGPKIVLLQHKPHEMSIQAYYQKIAPKRSRFLLSRGAETDQIAYHRKQSLLKPELGLWHPWSDRKRFYTTRINPLDGSKNKVHP